MKYETTPRTTKPKAKVKRPTDTTKLIKLRQSFLKFVNRFRLPSVKQLDYLISVVISSTLVFIGVTSLLSGVEDFISLVISGIVTYLLLGKFLVRGKIR